MNDEVLRIKNLSGGYLVKRDNTLDYIDAVNDVNIIIKRDEVFGIAGESGCGKSTLLKLLYGYVKSPLIIKKGEVLLSESTNYYLNILSLKNEEVKKKIWWKYISWIPQNSMNVLNPTIRIKDHFLEILRMHMKIERDEAHKLIVEYLGLLGLSKDIVNAFPHQLSGGMRQRIIIALALITRPKIVLADEPTTALDVVVQRGILQWLGYKQRELKNTMIIVSHDLSIHAMLSKRIGIMYAGKIVEISRSENIFEKPLHPYTQLLLSSLPRLGDKSLRIGITGSPPDLIRPPLGCRFHPRCPYCIERCIIEEPDLTEAEKDHFIACSRIEKR
ncbi:MAG: ABC transporter ATP-binding protein [Aigarchaeota archaeon]|nr:ABC transporter ATP-binding protein [Aigarchaeota archaeon]MCX8193410.1 ABC transporter ATP-binding protein [Nitrososphaeria archaeon]MDW7985940.1 ABC transporter ATP-binding protein [Nitrososphaerota archaeon]